MSILNMNSKCFKIANNIEISLIKNTRHPFLSISRISCSNTSQNNPSTQKVKERVVGVVEIKESNGKIETNPPRGTRDFFPEDMRVQKWLYEQFSIVSEAFGFEQVDSPVLESESLFTRKAGEEITEQLYNFVDKGERRVALRPELTPSLARMVLQKGKALALPVKWFAIGQCWRYERMSRGRRREHYQWNMDIVGVEGLEAEAELLAALTLFFENVGLTSKDVGIKISSRKVLQEILSKFNVKENLFGATCVIVDKINKLPKNEIVAQLLDLGLAEKAIDGLFSSITLKSLEDLKLLLGHESLAIKDLEKLEALGKGYGIGEWLEYDFGVIRGLAYYTGTVFEAFDRSGNLRAICGGGRYDKLLSTFGSDDQPCVGFGFGDAVIMELLKDKNLIPALTKKVDDFIFVCDESLRPQANGIAQGLRRKGRKVELVLEEKKIKWAFKQVERIGAERMIIVGQNEWEKGCVRVKYLKTREESDIDILNL